MYKKMMKYVLLFLIFFSTESFSKELVCWSDTTEKQSVIQKYKDKVLYNGNEFHKVGIYYIKSYISNIYHNEKNNYYITLVPHHNSYDYVIIYGDSEKDPWDGGYCVQK